jgi:16S rRNA (adenine1518-N6/adenine1519-N6)-dimethyltransferase
VIKAKKSLGQNFLIDRNIIDRITNSVTVQNRTLLEVGPGTGNLTSALLKKNPKKFFVVEKDDELISSLEKKFKDEITIIHDDILSFNENFLSKDKIVFF